MTKEEFIKQKVKLEDALEELKKEYLESNSVLSNGTKVVVHHRHYGGEIISGYDEYGIVVGYELSVLDEVKPIIAKMKKDGTAHPKAKVYVAHNEDVEPYK